MNNTEFSHIPVMLDECIDGLNIDPDGIYTDCTAGGGGHSFAIASKLSERGRLVSFDQDADAVRAASERLAGFGERTLVIRSNFTEAAEHIRSLGYGSINGALLDLGVSSYQLDAAERGFSYMQDAPLDMRMDRDAKLDAATIVNTFSQKELTDIIYKYGEERFAPRIAAAIVEKRQNSEDNGIKTTLELAELIKSAIPAKYREKGSHPAKRTFQAIRIAVNRELDVIEPTLRSLAALLCPGGRIAVITFHSLEDRIVKQTFAELCTGCICPKELPVCVCGRTPMCRHITKKPLLPSEHELELNSRSHSAKLRIIEKL